MTQPLVDKTDDIAIRLRRWLAGDLPAPAWPRGFTLRPFQPADARAVHALLVLALKDEDADFERWWAVHSGDAEFDPGLWLVVDDVQGRLAAVALSWTSDFLKYLAVRPDARRKGLAEALLLHVFATFQARGAARVDLKTRVIENADAIRLYRRLGMVEVDWMG